MPPNPALGIVGGSVMRKVRFPTYIAASALSVTAAAHAEGIALGNQLAGGSFVGFFGLPILVSATLLLVMALVKGLGKALLVALLLCGLFAGTLAFIGAGGMSNGKAMFWLAGLVLSPWICLVIITICFIVGICTNKT